MQGVQYGGGGGICTVQATEERIDCKWNGEDDDKPVDKSSTVKIATSKMDLTNRWLRRNLFLVFATRVAHADCNNKT